MRRAVLVVAIALARLVGRLAVPVLWVLRFLVILRGMLLLALVLFAQALWDLRWGVLLFAALLGVLSLPAPAGYS